MNSRIFFPLTLCVSALLTPKAECQAPEEVVKKAIEATGGAKLLKKYPASKAASKGTVYIAGMSVPFTAEETHQLPDKVHNVITLELGGQKITIEQVGNGDKFKMNANGAASEISDPVKEEMKEANYVAELSQLVPLAEDKKLKLEKIEKPESYDGEEVNGILVKSKGHKDVKLFFSKKTNLLVSIERKGLDPEEKEVTELTKFSDFKKVDGIMHPTKTEILHDGEKFMTAEETEYKNLEKADASEFDISD